MAQDWRGDLSNDGARHDTGHAEMTQNFPEDLAVNGVRHDNDHADIADIQILPTAQEIASLRPEYLPSIDPTQHHLPGLAGLLDRQFRLLREDVVGQLRGALREEIARLAHPDRVVPVAVHGQGMRRLIYHSAHFSRICVDRREGLQVVAEFDQPPEVDDKTLEEREEWWNESKLLQGDSLLCFVSPKGKVIFLSVSAPMLPLHGEMDTNSDEDEHQADDSPSLFKNARRASVLLKLAEYKKEDVIWISTHMAASKTRNSIMEFPRVLLASFQPVLKALQAMSRTLSMPFMSIVAPHSEVPAAFIQPPAYATESGFSFNLDCLAGVPLTLKPEHAFDFAKLDSGSSLDKTQQLAVVSALTTELALIQGPPGTGKSHTGVAIIKTLLHNREAANLGPIICVCYTNHALDQLLEHLVKDGVTEVIRLGSGSKSDLLRTHILHHLREDFKPTKGQKNQKRVHKQ